MHDDDMIPNVRTQKKARRTGEAKNLLECEVGEVVTIAVRVCRHTAGSGGTEPDAVFVNSYNRKEEKEIFSLFCIPRAALVPLEADSAARVLMALKEVMHLLPHPDDVIIEEDAEKLRALNRLLYNL